jgi:hypothetical protein
MERERVIEEAAMLAADFGLLQYRQNGHADLAALEAELVKIVDSRAKDSHVQAFCDSRAGGRLLEALKPATLSTMPLQRPRPTARNLIYHVCPLKANDIWLRNLVQLGNRRKVFNGSRVFAVATGPEMEPAHKVQDEIVSRVGAAQIFPLPNCRVLREVATFLPLLLAVQSTGEREATFYGHTKGNSTDASVLGATYWRNAMYHHLLDRAGECMDALQTHAFVGCHKMVWPRHCSSPFPTRLAVGNWMLAGTFFWFRNDFVFKHPAWRRIPMDR